MTAQVHVIFEKNCSDIPAMLRESADCIETEEAEGYSRTRAMVAVQISEDGHVQVYGWGKTDSMHCIALLQLGMTQIAQGVLDA